MGKAVDGATGPSRAEAAAFVSNHSPEPQDLLPGLCLLTERWLPRVSSCSMGPESSTSLLYPSMCIGHLSADKHLSAQSVAQ